MDHAQEINFSSPGDGGNDPVKQQVVIGQLLSGGNSPVDRALAEKIALMEKRLRAMDLFANLSVTEFINRLPGFERLMAFLGQSVTDVCHALVCRYADASPKSLIDIISMCGKYGIFPESFVRSLAHQMLIIDNGYERIDAMELLQIHKDLPETNNLFHEFVTRSRNLA